MLEKAVESARMGRYDSALDGLAELGGRESADPRVLDLLARVHAQRGEFADADSCWSRALDVDPAWQAAMDGRRRIAALQAKRFRPSLVLPGVVVLAVAAGVLFWPAEPTPPPAPLSMYPADPRVDQLQRDVTTLRAELDAPQNRVNRLVVAVTDPRFGVTRQGGSVLVTFTDDQFTRGTRLTAVGKTALADLGARLKPFTDNNSISVVGYAGTADLGLRRAQTAVVQLGLPSAAVNLRSAGPTQPSVTVVIDALR